MINERLFGSPISGKVKKKLEDRQRVAGEVAPGESIEAVYPDKDGNNQADLSSRTPFIRMWTGVKLTRPEAVTQYLTKLDVGSVIGSIGLGITSDEQLLNQLRENNKKKLEELKKTFPSVGIIAIPNQDKVKEYYIVPDEKTELQGEAATRTYIVGDYNYQTSYGSVEPTDSIQVTDEGNSSLYEELLPDQLRNNSFLKPQAGILGLSSEHITTGGGVYGASKQTTITFVVHNFEDFDKIYNRYFLKPGATIFIDFGWSSVKNLYNPNDLLNATNVLEYLYGDSSNVVPGYEDEEGNYVKERQEVDGQITKYQGDLEVIQGRVNDYNAKILKNGSVECSVTLISANDAMLSFKTNTFINNHIKDVLNRATLNLGLQAILSEESIKKYVSVVKFGQPYTFEVESELSDLLQLKVNTPNSDTSPKDIEKYNEVVALQAFNLFGSNDLTPRSDAIRLGVYVNNLQADDIYVCWGFLEDIIFNQNFGFGISSEDINNGINLHAKMDSSNSFTTFDKLFIERQKFMAEAAEGAPVVIFPEWWGASDPEDDDSKGSYNYFNGKYPRVHYESDEHTLIDAGFGNENSKGKERIPIREIFVNVETITSAFETNNNVRGVLNDILKAINDDTYNVLDLQYIMGETDSRFQIIDANRPDIHRRIQLSGKSNSEKQRDEFENMFMFNVMSPNSIIKDYELNFKIPTGELGNILANEAMTHMHMIKPGNISMDSAVKLSTIQKDSLSIVHLPTPGGHRGNQLNSQENKEGEIFDVYGAAERLIDSNIYKTSATRQIGTNNISDDVNTFKSDPNETNNINNSVKDLTDEQKTEKSLQDNIEALNNLGGEVATTFKDYFRLTSKREILAKEVPTTLPYNLNLTTQGIGSIQIGDTFRADYLPKDHFENTYLQTLKVNHDVNTDGWYTTLDTVYRPVGDTFKDFYELRNVYDSFISPKLLQNTFSSHPFLQNLIPFMYAVKVTSGIRKDGTFIEFQIRDSYNVMSKDSMFFDNIEAFRKPVEPDYFQGDNEERKNLQKIDDEGGGNKTYLKTPIGNGVLINKDVNNIDGEPVGIYPPSVRVLEGSGTYLALIINDRLLIVKYKDANGELTGHIETILTAFLPFYLENNENASSNGESLFSGVFIDGGTGQYAN